MFSGCWRALASTLQSIRKGLSGEETECRLSGIVEGNGKGEIENVFLVPRSSGVCVGRGH